MRPNVTSRVTFSGSVPEGYARHWRDLLDVSAHGDGQAPQVRAAFADGHPAYVKHGPVHYLASLFDEASTQALFARIAHEAGLAPEHLGDAVRVSRRGSLTWVFNYGPDAYRLPAEIPGDAFVIGAHHIEAQGVAAYRTPN